MHTRETNRQSGRATRTLKKAVATLAAVFLSMATMVAGIGAIAARAGASTGPLTPTTVTVQQTPHVICRAYGGSLSANSEADQDLGFAVTYPRDIHARDTFNIKIRQHVAAFPQKQATGNGIFPQATIYNVWGSAFGYQLPAGLTINSVTQAPINGNTNANADAGYYVAAANVPQVQDPNNSLNVGPDPNFDPLTLDPSKRVAIPGIAPNAYWNTTTNRVYTTLLGDNTAGSSTTSNNYQGGSMVQAPTVTVNVTANANLAAGSHLNVTLAGSLPAGGSFTGSQPGNFPAPVNGSTAAGLVSAAATAPWFSTDGTRWVYQNGGSWTDPTYTTVATANAVLTVSAAAACAPGWESTSDFPTPPSYYTGASAIANGTSPPLSDTVVEPYAQINTPADGASYIAGQSLNADYHCWASISEEFDSCTGTVPNGSPIDTTVGPHSFTVNGTDGNNDPVTKTVNYTVVAAGTPTANPGAAQTGKAAGTVVTLNGSASTSPNAPLTYTDVLGVHPAGANTFTWLQTGGPAVTLSDPHAIQPTFQVAPVTSPSGDTYTFSLTVNDGTAQNSASTTVASVASTPTAGTPTKARAGGGTSFFVGDQVTLSTAISNPDGTNPAD
jgi:hypothetical protein